MLVGIVLVAAFVLVMIARQVVSGRPPARVWTLLCFFLVEMPVMMAALSATFRWVQRRKLGSFAAPFASLVVAGALGSLFMMGMWSIVTHVSIGSVSHRMTTLKSAAGTGFIVGLLHAGVWALAFVYPLALEESRLAALRAQKHEIEAQQLRSAAELARLRSQLEPHFLLNTLNTVAGLVTQDPDEARRLIACLGDLLRDVLEENGELQTLGSEVAWLRRYTEILEARHAGRLAFKWQIDDDAVGVMLPKLLLQPLVENAVKHGALRRGDGGGEVTVRAAMRATKTDDVASQLEVIVEDNGPGFEKDERSGGVGLRVIRRRLQLSPQGGNVRLEQSTEGTRAIVEIPMGEREVSPS